MRTATSVLTVLVAGVVAVVVSVSFLSQANDQYTTDQSSAHVTAKHQEAASADFSAEASQLVVDRA
jgi:hypothetical protein